MPTIPIGLLEVHFQHIRGSLRIRAYLQEMPTATSARLNVLLGKFDDSCK